MDRTTSFSAQFSDSGEAHFGYDELIYSRTDQRGVIASGNSVFQRMCQRPGRS